MNLTNKQFKKILNLIELIYMHSDEREMRLDIAVPLLDLLHADYFASFIWNTEANRYENEVFHNMSDTNIVSYSEYYQFRDPITRRLSVKRNATLVSQILPQKELMKTEFFNDFLFSDGLFHGINLHLYNYSENIGDLRIWRKKGIGNFNQNSCLILDILKPHLINSFRKMRSMCENKTSLSLDMKCEHLKRKYQLSLRESEVVRHLINGERDEIISELLHIGKTTVRTHIKNIFAKTGINNRNKLFTIE